MKTLSEYVTDYKQALEVVSEANSVSIACNLELRPLREIMQSRELICTPEFVAYDKSTDALALALQTRYTIAQEAIRNCGFDTFYDAVEE